MSGQDSSVWLQQWSFWASKSPDVQCSRNDILVQFPGSPRCYFPWWWLYPKSRKCSPTCRRCFCHTFGSQPKDPVNTYVNYIIKSLKKRSKEKKVVTNRTAEVYELWKLSWSLSMLMKHLKNLNERITRFWLCTYLFKTQQNWNYK